MTKLKISSGMHIMIIVTSVIVAIGIAVGLICEFIAGGYFNYGAEYTSYNSVVVDYVYIDQLGDSDVKEICDKTFKEAGVSYFSSHNGTTDDGNRWEFRFSFGQSASNVEKSAKAIDLILSGNDTQSSLSHATFHKSTALIGNTPSYVYGAIALATIVVFEFLYFLLRYRVTSAFTALLANVHNFAIFISLLTITRTPIGSQVVVFAILTALMTMIGCAFYFDRIRKNAKNEELAKLDSKALSDLSLDESYKNTVVSAIGVTASALILLVLLSISAMSVTMVLTSVLSAVFGAIACVYGTLFFIPSVYPRIKDIGDKAKIKLKKSK